MEAELSDGRSHDVEEQLDSDSQEKLEEAKKRKEARDKKSKKRTNKYKLDKGKVFIGHFG